MFLYCWALKVLSTSRERWLMTEITWQNFLYLSSLASFSPCSGEIGLWPLAFKSAIVFSSVLRSTCDRLQILAWPFQETISSRYKPTPSTTTTTTTTSQHLKWLSIVHLGANQHYRTGGGMMPHLNFFLVFLSFFIVSHSSFINLNHTSGIHFALTFS